MNMFAKCSYGVVLKHCEIHESFNIVVTKCFQTPSDTNAFHLSYYYFRVNFIPKLI